MSGEEMKYINEAFDTNWISPMGPNIDCFEKQLVDYLNIRSVAALSSGTAAIHLALQLLNVCQGDYVISSTFTFSASVNPIAYLKAIPVLIDSEPDTWNMDPDILRFALEDLSKKGIRPKAIIVIHLYGMPAKLNKIIEIAREFNVPIIEDAAEALGSKYKNQYVGTFGEIGILSFNGNKIITTSGGGALISNNKDYVVRARFLATQARDDAPHYQHTEIGYNYRMSNIVAGIGRGQMEYLEERVHARRANKLFYSLYLNDISGIDFQLELPEHFSNYWLTCILVDPEKTGGIDHEVVRLALDKENIEARPLWKPMHLQPVYKDAVKYINHISEDLFNKGLCLPSGSNLNEDDKIRIINIVRKSLKKEDLVISESIHSKKLGVKVPFSPPRMDRQVIASVEKTLLSGWITTGPKTKKFEGMLSAYCGNKETLCVSSATNGLELILRWFGVKPGDEVILPSYTYCATGNVVLRCGAKPVLVDINSNDFLISLTEIERHITNRTKVIIPVDFGGLTCDYDEIAKLVNRPDIKAMFNPSNETQKMLGRILVLSDAAHSLGATYKGKRTGTIADTTVFSFHAVKNLTTAEGGAIALNLPDPFNLEDIYKTLRISSLHGQTKDALMKSTDGEWKYDVVAPGLKANMTDVLASIGLVELERYESETLKKLRWVFRRYDELLKAYSWAELPIYKTADKETSYHIYALRLSNATEKQRDRVIRVCHKMGVMVNVHFIPLSMFSAYKKLGYKITQTPVAYEAFSREISLPVYYDISEEKIRYVVSALAMGVKEVLSEDAK